MSENRLLSAALAYAQRKQWPVFPLRPKTKEPATPHGFKDATTGEAQIRRWWAQWPNANVALPTGLDFWVLDVDPRNSGSDSLETLRHKHGPLPDTLQQTTGGGGRQYFWAQSTPAVGCMVSVWDGIDVRGLGGYVAAPPSIHPSGNAYVWDGLAPFHQQAIAPAPAWLLVELAAKANRPKSRFELPDRIRKGQQHTILFRFGSQLRARGLEEAEIFRMLWETNLARCEEPGPEENMRKLAASVCRQYKPGQSGAEWSKLLVRNARGKAEGCVQNVITALEYAPEWNGVLAYNQFSLGQTALAAPPFPAPDPPFAWGDVEDIRTAAWLQTTGLNVGRDIAGQGISAVARLHPFHPVRDYLEDLVWDEVSRIDDWLLLYLGCEDSPYVRSVAAKWLTGAVARIFDPGCKNDSCLILEGEQGTLKSTALRVLAGDWFSDDMPELGSKDAALNTRGRWIIELSELDAMTGADVSRIKAFISRAVDYFRPPYARHPIAAPRECIFAGTSNHNHYLKDETGGRRFWPIRCGKINVDDLKRDRDRIWAEAVMRYRRGDSWWLDSHEVIEIATSEQNERFNADPWQPLIEDFLESRTDVTIDQLLLSCLERPKKDWTQSDKNRVSRCLHALGWERFQKRVDSFRREWRYRKKSLGGHVLKMAAVTK